MASMSTKDIPAEELKELRTMFNTLDKDRKGIIGPPELSALMKTIGVPHTAEDVVALLKEVDEDGNGEIEFHEFARAMSRRIHLPGIEPRLILQAFRTIAGKTAEIQGKGVVPVPPGCIHSSQIRFVLEQLGPLDSIPPAAVRVLQGTDWAYTRKHKVARAAVREKEKKGAGGGPAPIRLPAASAVGSSGAEGESTEFTPGVLGGKGGGGGTPAHVQEEDATDTAPPTFDPGSITNLLSSMTPDEGGWINYEVAVANFLNER